MARRKQERLGVVYVSRLPAELLPKVRAKMARERWNLREVIQACLEAWVAGLVPMPVAPAVVDRRPASEGERRIIGEVERWYVAPEDQGQTIEIAYGAAGESERMVQRTTDRSSGVVTYALAPAPDVWEPWNQAPESDAWGDGLAL